MAAAKKCTPLNSSWINMAILMCNNTLFVQFKNGFCCNYLRSTQAHYLQIVAAHSPGHWLRRNLYRILPYQAIRLPCPPAGCGVVTGCCPSLPTTLYATGDNGYGTQPLVYDGSFYWASSPAPVTCGANVQVRLYCDTGDIDCSSMLMKYNCDGVNWHNFVTNPFTCNCSPLHLEFSGTLSPIEGCAPCAFTTLNITVTL